MNECYEPRLCGLESLMRFGRHKGHTIRWIINNDAKYMEWAIYDAHLRLDSEAFDHWVSKR